jgi:hypothetical protein
MQAGLGVDRTGIAGKFTDIGVYVQANDVSIEEMRNLETEPQSVRTSWRANVGHENCLHHDAYPFATTALR